MDVAYRERELTPPALERRLCCTWRRSTAVARLDEYMRAECAAHKMVTAVLVVDP